MSRGKMKKKFSSLLQETSSILRIGTTGREILRLLMQTGDKLSVPEIVSRIHRSERAVRGELGKFVKNGLVRRVSHLSKHGRRVYSYFVPCTKDFIKSTKRAVLKQLGRLKRY